MTRETQTPRVDAEAVRFARIMVEWPEPTGKADWGAKTTELIPADFARTLETQAEQLAKALRELLETSWEDSALDARDNARAALSAWEKSKEQP